MAKNREQKKFTTFLKLNTEVKNTQALEKQELFCLSK